MSKKKKDRSHKVEVYCCLADGSAVIVKREYPEKLSDEDLVKDFSETQWLRTESCFIRPAHITLVKHITWSEE